MIYWWSVPIPSVFGDSVSYMGRCVTFLSMIVLGVSLANMKLREVFTEKKLYIYCDSSVGNPDLVCAGGESFVKDP